MLIQFSESWLREWVKISFDNKYISEQLTLSGIEVENINPVAIPFKGVIIGEIICCKKYSNSKDLNIFKVNVGKKLINIIDHCYFVKGTKVAVAIEKKIFSNSNKIKKSISFNENCEGAFCSFDILLIEKDSKEIIILPNEAPTGESVYKYLNLKDFIFKVNITPNRSDCLSILGIARDISAINDTPLIWPKINKIPAQIKDSLPVNINLKKNIINYFSRIIKNINVLAKTPIWMCEKLRRSGIKTINAITDISNYVALELGQPIIFFDFNKINSLINIRMSKKGEIFKLSKNKDIVLDENILITYDKEKIISITGIIESFLTTVNNTTNNIFLECVFFNPSVIIGKLNNYHLLNDRVYKYERGIDSQIQNKAINRATHLILEICGGQVGPVIKNYVDKNDLSKKIFLKRKKINLIIGCKLPKNDIINFLNRLNFSILESNKYGWLIQIPSWRFDIKIEENIIEEIIRIYGYKKIPNINIKSKLTVKKDNKNNKFLKKAKYVLINQGYQEVINYSFLDPNYQILFHPYEKSLTLKNPISIEMSNMRLSLLSGLTKTAIYNQNRQKETICIFESGFCFMPDKNCTLGIRQELKLSALITGKRYNDYYWNFKQRHIDFYDIKGDLELIFHNININYLNKITFYPENNPAFHIGQSASIYLNNEKIGIIGALNPKIEKELNFKSKVFIFEILWDKVINKISFSNEIKKFSKFPFNYRDISFFIDKKISIENILNVCKKFFEENDLEFFDISLLDIFFIKNKFNKTYKSISLRIKAQFMNKNIEEQEIQKIIKKLIEKLKSCFSILLRDKVLNI